MTRESPYEALLSRMSRSSEEMVELIRKQNTIIEAQSRTLNALQARSDEHRGMLEVLGRIGLRDILADAREVIQSRQMGMMETVEQVAEGKSIARWGDGEIKLMLQPEFDLMYQKGFPALAAELKEMLSSYDDDSSRIILAMPTFFSSRLWMGIFAENWHLLRPILEESRSKWGNTHVSRPLFFQRHGRDAVEAWRRVWNDRRICIIAGRGSKFELLPDLFDNVASVERIDSEPADAYVTLPDLKHKLRAVSDIDLFLIALGPSGTVLAGYLSSEEGGGHHAIDIGHLASSYLNVFKGGRTPEQLPTRAAP
ncbi:GT-D fold domain-containing glycosyltransferase [Pseudarthrobacter sp. O4]|uniref:GT-D fold domain-containing glycosyltransferase n=1 Tax=Pseudarthrobacter sp. O4 TaxID=3418417 RepID=UPI003CED2949